MGRGSGGAGEHGAAAAAGKGVRRCGRGDARWEVQFLFPTAFHNHNPFCLREGRRGVLLVGKRQLVSSVEEHFQYGLKQALASAFARRV
jgi:hypothetical protein